MAKSEMDFRNFYEFIDFCRNVDIKNWSEIEVREFNKKVYSLMRDDISFKEKYTKLSAKLKKQLAAFSGLLLLGAAIAFFAPQKNIHLLL